MGLWYWMKHLRSCCWHPRSRNSSPPPPLEMHPPRPPAAAGPGWQLTFYLFADDRNAAGNDVMERPQWVWTWACPWATYWQDAVVGSGTEGRTEWSRTVVQTWMARDWVQAWPLVPVGESGTGLAGHPRTWRHASRVRVLQLLTDLLWRQALTPGAPDLDSRVWLPDENLCLHVHATVFTPE